MRGLVIALGIVAALYAADSIGFDGKYSGALTDMTRAMWRNFTR